MIEYTSTIDDNVTFSDYHFRHSPFSRRLRLVSALSTAVLFLLLLMRDGDVGWGGLVWTAGTACALWFLYPRFNRWHVRRLLSEGRKQESVGWHRVVLCDTLLRGETKDSAQETRYEALGRIVETNDHVFVYVAPRSAHVIPKTSVTVGDLAGFVEELQRRIRAAGAVIATQNATSDPLAPN